MSFSGIFVSFHLSLFHFGLAAEGEANVECGEEGEEDEGY